MISVNYHEVEDIDLDEIEMHKWLGDVVQRFGKSLEYLEVTFCTDDFLLGMNRQYLNHDYYTDILSFDLSDNSESIKGELYISLERVRENADKENISWIDEVHRVIVHGVLHFCGFEDADEVKKSSMTQEENIALALRMF